MLVTAALLRWLHAEGPPPERLQVRLRAANHWLPVVGVLAQPLPGELHFLLTELHVPWWLLLAIVCGG